MVMTAPLSDERVSGANAGNALVGDDMMGITVGGIGLEGQVEPWLEPAQMHRNY